MRSFFIYSLILFSFLILNACGSSNSIVSKKLVPKGDNKTPEPIFDLAPLADLDYSLNSYALPIVAGGKIIFPIFLNVSGGGQRAGILSSGDSQVWEKADFSQSAYPMKIVRGDNGDIYIFLINYLSSNFEILRSVDDGATWNSISLDLGGVQLQSIADANFNPNSWIFVGSGLYGDGQHWFTFRSTDNGATWTKVDELLPLPGSTTAGTPKQLFKNNGVYFLQGWLRDTENATYKHVIRRSANDGVSWSFVNSWPADLEIVQLEAGADNSIFAFVKPPTSSTSSILLKKSLDGGRTWTDLPEAPRYIELAEEFLSMVYMHDTNIYTCGVTNAVGGYSSVIRVSQDQGLTWRILRNEPGLECISMLRFNSDNYLIERSRMTGNILIYSF